jgi:hypothetical protein
MMNSARRSGGGSGEAAAVGDVECEPHQKSWETFGVDAVQVIPDDGGDTGNGASRDGADGAPSSVGFC